MRVCIIIPMFNEEKSARQSVETIISYVKELSLPTTVLVVNDGSSDATQKIVQELIPRDNTILKIISHSQNQGYGAAIRTGIQFACANNYDYALFMDSDLTNHPRYLKDFYQKMQEGHDYIKANRYGPGAGIEGVPLSRKIVSKVGNGLARWLYRIPLSDLTNGFRAVKVSILKQLELTESGFAIIMEELLLAKPLVHSYAQVPHILTSRKSWQGQTHFKYDIKTYRRYLTYALKSVWIKQPVT